MMIENATTTPDGAMGSFPECFRTSEARDINRFSSTQPNGFVALRLRDERPEIPNLRLRKGYELFIPP
jgi:hypothetical protein